MLEVRKIHDITVVSEHFNKCNCVYKITCEDGFTLYGQTGSEGVWSRMQKRFSSKKEYKVFEPHIRKSARITVDVVCEYEDETYRTIVEQFCIFNEFKKHINEYCGKEMSLNTNNIMTYRNLSGYKEYVDKYCGNKTLDKKDALRFYFAHRDKFSDIDMMHKVGVN